MKKGLLTHLVLAFSLLFFSGSLLAQTAVPMATQSGYSYTENFTDIGNWAANFASGIGASRWGAVVVNATGTIPDGVKTTVSTATFSTAQSGGVQKGTNVIQMLSTATANSCAIDFFLNFTGVNAGTISFDVAELNNSTGDRDSKLKLYYSTNGTTFTEITGTNLPYTARNNVASSASISVALPSAFNGSSTARLRFYEYSTTAGATPTGSQPKITIDNVVVTATAPTTQASNVSFGSVLSTSMNVSWTNGNGSRRAVFMKETSGTITNTSDATLYSASTNWSSKGTQLGSSGYYCIYDGTGTSVSLSNLVAGTAYYVQAFEYNSDGTPTASTIKYLTTTATNNPNNQSTAAGGAPTKLVITSVNGGSSVGVSPSTFSVTVQAQDNSNTQQNVSANTDISLSLHSGTGALGGTVTGTISSGSNSTTISGISYNTAESGVSITAARTSGDVLTSGNSSTFIVYAAEPTAQATGLTFSNLTTTSYNISFSAASGTPDGYIVLRRQGSAPTGTPVDGATYSQGNTNINSGTNEVVYVGALPSPDFSQSGLTSGTQYFYSTYSYNGSGSTINYYTTSPLAGNVYTLADEPTTASTTLSFSSITSSTMTLSWANGNGSRRLVLMKSGASVNAFPADGSSNTASSTFGSGTQVGSGNYVVYDGTGTTTGAISGLTSGTTYYVAVVEYNGTGANANTNFYTSSTLTGNQQMPTDYLSLTTLGNYSNEDFNTLGTSGTASLPLYTRMNSATDWATGATAATQSAGTSGTGIVSGSSGGGYYNWANGITGSSTDRSIGILSSGSFSSPRSIIIKVRNNTGSSVTALQVNFDYEKYRSGSNAAGLAMTFFHGADGSSWTAATSGNQTYTADANNTTVSDPPLSSSKNITITGLNISNGADYYLRWTYTSGGASAIGLGVDNISIAGFTQVNASNANVGAGTVSDLNISGGTTTLTGDVIISGGVNIANGATIEIGNNSLTINGAIGSGTGVIKGSAGSSLSITGSGAFGSLRMDQTSTGATNRLKDFTLNRGTTPGSGSVTLSNAMEVTGTIDLQNGTLNTGGNLTLLSLDNSATGTARIGIIDPSKADISGNVTAQRFVPGGAGKRRYRTFSPPVSNFTWNQLIDNIFISGQGGGFDATSTNNPSVFTYQENPGAAGGRGWQGATDLAASVSAGTGLLVFVRGDRTQTSSLSSASVTPNDLTIDYSGPVNKGTITPTTTWNTTGGGLDDDGWNLVGNPYPSQIDWASGSISKTNIESSYYVYDPSSGSYVSASTGTIGLGQAFFIHADGNGAPGISFNEGCKIATSPTNYFKTGSERIALTMTKDAFNSDIAWIGFESAASAGFNGQEDARKFPNSVINFGFTVDGINVQNNVVPMTADADTFTLFAAASPGNYTLGFSNVNAAVPSSKNVYLKDLFTNNVIDIRTVPSYAFAITSAAGSSGNRFQLIISEPAGLPVDMTAFYGEKTNNEQDVLLHWVTAKEYNSDRFVVERAVDHTTEFSEIGTIKANNNTTAEISYTFNDKDVLVKNPGALFYRLRQVDKDGSFQYSKVISLSSKGLREESMLYPNPAKDLVHIKLSSEMAGNVQADVYNIVGKLCMQENTFVLRDSQIPVDISKIQTGIYFITLIQKSTGKQETIKFRKE